MAEPVKDEGLPPQRSLAERMSLISRFTLLSRVLGLARDQLFAALVGAGMHADAFVTAFRIPNLMRDLFAEGALSAAFVPTYARSLKTQGRAEAQRLAIRMMTLLTVVLTALVALGLVLAPQIVHLLSPGFDQVAGKKDLAVQLTRIMLPFLPLVSLAAVAMGMLNAEERYGPPAIAPAMFNVAALIVGAGLWAAGLSLEQVVVGWSVGTLLGGVAQFAIQVPDLRRLSWRFSFEWAPLDPRIREILVLMGPATLGLAAAQVNIFIGSNFASHEQGAQVWLQNAFRIMYLPIGLFGVAMGTITATGSAHRVVAGDFEGLRRGMRDSLRLVSFLTIPATVGIVILARPMVRLIFEHGRFRPGDTAATAGALTCYALGLVAYTAVKVLAPAFYSLGSARIPLCGSLAAVATSVCVMFVTYRWGGFQVVALGTSGGGVGGGRPPPPPGAVVNVGLLAVVFERRIGGLGRQGLSGALARMALASVVMAGGVWLACLGLERWLGTRGLWAQLVTGMGPVLLGGALYLGVACWWRIPEAAAVLGALRRHVGLRRFLGSRA
jgi:putative peptidoglycan lipid II flippase